MSQVVLPAKKETAFSGKKAVVSVAIFLLIAAVGLLYIKWWPYYHKAFIAAEQHSIGNSILSGTAETAPAPSWQTAWEYAKAYYKSVWMAALLGLLLGSLVQVLIPRQWLARLLGRSSFASTLLGGLIALPGMMCTCCAAPIAVGLRKQNASVGSALAFWMGNPLLNPATLVFMTFVLSWKFTVLRIIFGVLLVFGVSVLANRLASDETIAGKLACQDKMAPPAETASWWMRWAKSLWTLAISIVPAYIAAVLLLGAVRAWLFPAIGDTGTNAILLIIGLSIAGMLFVIPTAAEIPIIQTLMSFGMGKGPAAALLVTLPAVSLPSLLMVSKSFSAKVLLLVAGAVTMLGIVCGFAGMMWL